MVLISVDTLRPDYIGYFNRRVTTTPNLDGFARENIVLTDVISQAPSTAISHKSILYSLYPSVHGMTRNQIPRETVLSPLETLQKNGYKTAAFVGGGELSHRFGFARGFDTYSEAGSFSDSETPTLLENLLKQAGEWLQKNSSQKFFLFLHTYEVHCPYYPPRIFRDSQTSWYQGNLDPRGKCGDNYYNQRSLPPADLKYVQALYQAEINYVDSFFGRLVDLLKTLDVYDRTLIVFLSDHAESLGERAYIGHNFLYEIQLRIPVIIRIPGLKHMEVNAPLEAIDIMPTLFQLLHVSPAYKFQGSNLLPLLSGLKKENPNRIQISEQSGKVRIRNGSLACIFDPNKNETPEVYNLKEDPLELNNNAGRHPEVIRDCEWQYYKMIRDSRREAASFLTTNNGPRLDESLKEQLKALGYLY